MSSRRIVIALAIAMLMPARFAIAADSDFTIAKTAVLPAPSLFHSGILPMVSATSKINLDPRWEYS